MNFIITWNGSQNHILDVHTFLTLSEIIQNCWYMGPPSFQWLIAPHRYKWRSLLKPLLTPYRHYCLIAVETVWINRGKHKVDKVSLPHQEECQCKSCQRQVSSSFYIPAANKMQKFMSCSDSQLSQATVEERIMT